MLRILKNHNGKIKTATFVNENTFFTSFSFLNKSGSQEIDAVKYPVATVEFDGNADFQTTRHGKSLHWYRDNVWHF